MKEEVKHCINCGSKQLNYNGGVYSCAYCGIKFKDETADAQINNIALIFGEALIQQKEEQVANARQNLWRAVNEEYTDSTKIISICREIKKLLPQDFQANFYEVANSGTAEDVNSFLDTIDVAANAIYLDDVVKFSIKSMDGKNISSVKSLIDRAFTGNKKTDYITKVEDEAQKLQEGIYSVEVPRDVFIAYSSKDMAQVNRIVNYLEEQGLTCFTALRNLRHGRGAKENYEELIKKAMHNCRCVVFLSSENSRKLDCDALRFELPYLRDVETGKGRIEYILEDYGKSTTKAAQSLLEGVFKGLEYCRTKEDLVVRIARCVTATKPAEKSKVKYCLSCGTENSLDTKFCKQCGGKQFVDTFEEYKRATLKQLEEEREKLTKDRQAATATATNKSSTKTVENTDDLEKLWHFDGANAPTLKNYNKSEFTINGGTLVKYRGRKERVVIPIGVTFIGAGAFEKNTNVCEIIVPDSVTDIYNSAFFGCTNLREIALPASVKSIGFSCFSGCVNLKKIEIPENVTRINKNTFYGCAGLLQIKLGGKISVVDEAAFGNCINLTTLHFESGLRTICKNAFYSCISMKVVNIPQSVDTIQKDAFRGCKRLTICCNLFDRPKTWDRNWNVCARYIFFKKRCKVEWGSR